MAIRFPARVKAKTSTAGTGTYTVNETSPAAGYRTFTQAVTDGDLANGDQVPYIAINTTVTNGPKLLEIGLGTWNNTAKTLTRDTVYQPNSTPVSWGASTQDIVVIDNPAIFLLLAGGTLTGILKILLSGAIISPNANTGLVVQRSATTATLAYSSVISGTAAVAGLNLGDTANELAGGIWYDNNADTLHLRTSATNRARIDSSGVLLAADGKKYVLLAGGNVNATVWYQSTAPAGWTKNTSQNDKALRVVSGVSGGTSGGSKSLSASTVDGTVLSLAQMPTHDHQYTTFNSTLVESGAGTAVHAGSTTGSTTTTGSSESHTHGLALAYVDVIICSLD